MADLRDEFKYRFSMLDRLSIDESQSRLSGFYEWMVGEPEIKTIIDDLKSDGRASALLEASGRHNPPQASTPELVAGVGVILLEQVHSGTDTFQLASHYGITPGTNSRKIQAYLNAMLERFISPAINHIFRQLPDVKPNPTAILAGPSQYPLEITDSLQRFLKDHPEPRRSAFIMMQFGSTEMHEQIVAGIKDTLAKYGITALRADDKEYHDDLFPNVLTYLYGCGFGIAVFERLEADDFNPNVSLEVGYMRALREPVCLLKDKTLKTLQTDLVGKLYKSFDPQKPEASIPDELDQWLSDKEIVT